MMIQVVASAVLRNLVDRSEDVQISLPACRGLIVESFSPSGLVALGDLALTRNFVRAGKLVHRLGVELGGEVPELLAEHLFAGLAQGRRLAGVLLRLFGGALDALHEVFVVWGVTEEHPHGLSVFVLLPGLLLVLGAPDKIFAGVVFEGVSGPRRLVILVFSLFKGLLLDTVVVILVTLGATLYVILTLVSIAAIVVERIVLGIAGWLDAAPRVEGPLMIRKAVIRYAFTVRIIDRRVVRHLGLKLVARVVALVQQIGAVADFACPVRSGLIRSGPALGSLFSAVLVVLVAVHHLVQGVARLLWTKANGALPLGVVHCEEAVLLMEFDGHETLTLRRDCVGHEPIEQLGQEDADRILLAQLGDGAVQHQKRRHEIAARIVLLAAGALGDHLPQAIKHVVAKVADLVATAEDVGLEEHGLRLDTIERHPGLSFASVGRGGHIQALRDIRNLVVDGPVEENAKRLATDVRQRNFVKEDLVRLQQLRRLMLPFILIDNGPQLGRPVPQDLRMAGQELVLTTRKEDHRKLFRLQATVTGYRVSLCLSRYKRQRGKTLT
ncbi:hypothetical protein IWZ01DRAFT_115443 [Phyllosticta capitalensis]